MKSSLSPLTSVSAKDSGDAGAGSMDGRALVMHASANAGLISNTPDGPLIPTRVILELNQQKS